MVLGSCSLGIASFTPKSKGGYKVEITESGKAVKGSPFTVNVGDGQVCASTKVKASGAIKDAKANVQNTINLDASAAGKIKPIESLKIIVVKLLIKVDASKSCWHT